MTVRLGQQRKVALVLGCSSCVSVSLFLCGLEYRCVCRSSRSSSNNDKWSATRSRSPPSNYCALLETQTDLLGVHFSLSLSLCAVVVAIFAVVVVDLVLSIPGCVSTKTTNQLTQAQTKMETRRTNETISNTRKSTTTTLSTKTQQARLSNVRAGFQRAAHMFLLDVSATLRDS